jgi:hypothetical protein
MHQNESRTKKGRYSGPDPFTPACPGSVSRQQNISNQLFLMDM